MTDGLSEEHLLVRMREAEWAADGVTLLDREEIWQLREETDTGRLFLCSPVREEGLPYFFGNQDLFSEAENRGGGWNVRGSSELLGFMVRFSGAAQGLPSGSLVLVIDLFDYALQQDAGCAVGMLEPGQDEQQWISWLSRARRRDGAGGPQRQHVRRI